MKRRLAMLSAIALMAVELTIAPHARAVLNSTVEPCREAVAKSSEKFLKKKMKTIQKCNEKNLKKPGDCTPADLDAKLAPLEQKLRDGIEKKCASLSQVSLHGLLAYPGKCADLTGGAFTLTDLEDCMFTSHEAAADKLIAIEYNTTSQLDSDTLNCQKAISKNAGKFTDAKLKTIQKCRKGVDKGQLLISGPDCATSDAKTVEKIAKAESKARAGIAKKCTSAAQVQTLGICSNSACTSFCGTCDPSCVADCVIATHGSEVDDTACVGGDNDGEVCNTDADCPGSPAGTCDPVLTFSDLIDFEYATPAICGDDAVDQFTEECDGQDDSACPGDCGAADSYFPCLCQNIPRERVIEHADSDLDNGWKGDSHDSGTVEGGGYVANLFDCDGVGDTLCTVGPSCSGGAHSPCTTDAQCSLLGQGTCRKSQIDVGPHCLFDPQTTCTNDGDCPTVGDSCRKQLHGAPLPLSSGAVSVCVLNYFTEDVVGTKDLATGSGAVRLRQNSVTHLTGTPSRPCPVCGGFCAGPVDTAIRHPCTTNADCSDVASHTCVTDPICSFGPSADKACRPDPPFGGETTIFGNTSIDCLPPPGDNVSGAGLDILFNPATTGTVNKLPSIKCDDPSFMFKTCTGGTNNGATCTTNSECPGGTCTFQCYCPNAGGVHQKPNDCDAACLGGANDLAFCSADSECPGGFCHLADCRPDLTAPVDLQPYEGACTNTFEGHCNINVYRTCTADSECQPPACTSCDPLDTCNIVHKNCFINAGTTNGGITRVGVADPTDPVTASIFCIANTTAGSVNDAAGLPGPGSLRQPETVLDVGF